MSAAPIPQGAMARFDPSCDSNMCESADGKFIAYCDHAAALAASEARADALEAELFAHESKEFNETQDALLRAEAAEQSLAEAVKDAERWRWLRKEHMSYGRSWHVREPCNNVAPIDIDAAIDALLPKGEGETS